MSREQLQDEKLAFQKVLLQHESSFGRPVRIVVVLGCVNAGGSDGVGGGGYDDDSDDGVNGDDDSYGVDSDGDYCGVVMLYSDCVESVGGYNDSDGVGGDDGSDGC